MSREHEKIQMFMQYTGRSWKQVLNPLARSSFQKKDSKSFFALRNPLICLLLRTLMSHVLELPRVCFASRAIRQLGQQKEGACG